MEITFKKYDLNNDLDLFNKYLAKASKDRYELRISKNNVYYLYDYDDREQRITRSKKEIIDILECCRVLFFANDEDKDRLENFIKDNLF